jgi:uncharacterized iron-regulated protein
MENKKKYINFAIGMTMTKQDTKLFCCAVLLILLLNLVFLKPQAVEAAHPTIADHYISVEFDLQTGSLKANSRITLPAGVNLHLDFSHLDVSWIVINGQEIEATQDKNYLNIQSAASQQEILLAYSKKIPQGSSPHNIISQSGITLIDSWYPHADQEMLYKLTAVIPENFSAVSEADEIIAFQVSGSKQLTFRFPYPLFSINFIAGPYTVLEENFGEDKKLYAYFFPEDQQLAEGYMAKARKYLERYEKMLGPYPYNRFSIVENRLPTGFAMPTFTLLGQSVVRLPFIVDTSLGHEVLHAWFGNGVRMSAQEGNWVEGLTTYLADQSFASDKGEDIAYRKAQLVKYQGYVRPDMELNLRNFSNVGHDVSAGQPVRTVGYNKSSMFFHMLQNRVGKDKFISALRDFYQRSRFKTAGWSDLQTSFESIAGADLGNFFSQWLDRIDIPVLLVVEPEVKNDKGYPILHFSIRQENDPPYNLEVPVAIKTSNEEIHKTLNITENSTTFEIPLATLPQSLIIDPEYDLMRKLAPEELPPTWSRFLGAQDKMAILPSEEYYELYHALLDQLKEYEGHIMLQDEVSNEDLATHSLLFLGSEGKLSRSLFAVPGHPDDGFTVDVRNNPLDPDQVAVLVSAANNEQVEMVAGKLRHYGKYSYLSFKDGRIQEKNITETENGIKVELVRLPPGIEVSSSQSFDDIIKNLLQYQVIYVGEAHTNYEDHLLQLEIIRGLYEHDPRLAIGMEMFPRDTQPVLERYLAGELDEKSFLKESHYFEVWRFDYRLYQDIINFARHKNLALVGLNLEKDIVSQVFKGGGSADLEPEDAELLPIDRKLDEPGYREMIKSAFMMHAGQGQNSNFGGFLQAQALWDETMAESIVNYLEDKPNTRMVVIAGRGHVDKHNAIPPRVSRRLDIPQAVVLNSSVNASETKTADFMFFTPPAALTPLPLLGVMLDGTEDEEGVLVKDLNPQGQAKDAGIRKDDIILAIGSEPINDIEDVKIALFYQEESESVTVKVRRRKLFGPQEINIEVPLKSGAKVHHM